MSIRLARTTTTAPVRPARARRAVALSAAGLAGVLLLSACGSDSDDAATTVTTGDRPSPSASSSTSAAYNDADVDFVVGMRPHHVQAVEMSEMVLAADPTPEVAALATRIKAAQTPEIEQLDALIEQFGADADGHSMGSMDMGMMSEQDMAALMEATGTDASRMFLEGMIVHHEGAIEMADVELADGESAQARDLAESIKAAQESEIAEMRELLASL